MAGTARAHLPCMSCLRSIVALSLVAAWLSCSLAACTSYEDSPEVPNFGEPHIDGREKMYAFLDEGDLASADMILADTWPVKRFGPVRLPSELTWEENPYDENYWRFIFYGLQPTAHLLWAFRTTGEARYKDKLLSILRGFSERGQTSAYTEDKHASAYRAMVLVNTYFQLKKLQALSPENDTMILELIARNGRFLADPENFEDDYNHGFAESAALLLVAENFPGFRKAFAWKKLASERLETILRNAVAPDGVIHEQALYYHYYALTQLWEIARWAREFAVGVTPSLASTTEAMIRFAAVVSAPDGDVPMFGASLPRDARTSEAETMQAIADYDPTFRFMFTSGVSGTAPPERCLLYPRSGVAIQRSSWGTAATFGAQSHVVFDVGPYRTSHSDLDALNVHLYAGGRTLLVDPGLYSYEPGVERTYFHGTSAHNTVTVDGESQAEGSAFAGLTASPGPESCYQSGWHRLYSGVIHRRAVVTLARDLVLVVDRLTSDSEHDYDQTWRLSPELKTTPGPGGATVTASTLPVLRIEQAAQPSMTSTVTRGSKSPFDGWYSTKYEVKEEADALRFKQRARNATFVSLLAAGAYAASRPLVVARGDEHAMYVSVKAAERAFKVDIGNLTSAEPIVGAPFARETVSVVDAAR